MLVNKGDKIKLVREMGMFNNIGEVCDVADIVNGLIYFRFGNGMHLGIMSPDEADRYFEKYEEPKINTVTKEMIDSIMEDVELEVITTFDKCTVVSAKLPNGFVITESSACVDPRNYDEEMGFEICMNKIVNKVWELEGYRLQCKLYEGDCYCDCDCDCEEECHEEEYLDCETCPERYNCM